MTSNEKLIHSFYQAFQNKDYVTMQNCYAEKAEFSDNVFQHLDTLQVKKMWEMLIKKSTDLKIEAGNIQADESNGSAEWIASYTFSKTNRKVINKVKAKFTFDQGKIVKHTDRFNFYKWSGQALGFLGIILGWSSLIKNKVRHEAMNNLNEFIAENAS